MTSAKPSSREKECKALLLLSIAQYLQKYGFSKTLKKFKAEAEIEEDGWTDSKLNLEEICLKFLDKRINTSTCSKESQELHTEESKGPGNVTSRELQHNQVDKKWKEKKKNDSISVPESVTKEENQQIEAMPKQATSGKSKDLKIPNSKNVASSELEKKSRDKKNKKPKSTSNEVAKDVEERQDFEKSKSMMDIKQAGSEGETIISEINKEAKPQKRKRLESEGIDDQTVEKEHLEQSKRRKKENKKFLESEEKPNVKVSQNEEVDLLESQATPSKNRDSNESVGVEKTAEKFTMGKDLGKHNSSAEPQSTTANSFQRIKADEVVFADERLKDNSYWAKGGAEIGYGAKAQEVLGQVRGKDFRHEKTKKKRGSYRGGQIDLQTHSVKFNYSDDE
ncbi:hypothetical protein SAY87_029753 [Trapa incisa]|uniref:Srp40 C-terminal domain-containing protein n=1 Tax=Trapa incisa TaxID=236973 RepID=A0AAN7Q9P6_9MYRT|nr:hypothetical protein SAY87_029753 [Trapa incisa]